MTNAEMLTAVETAISDRLAGRPIEEWSASSLRYRYTSLKDLIEIRTELRASTGATRSRIRLASVNGF